MKRIAVFLIVISAFVSCSGRKDEFRPVYREDIKNYEFIKDFYQNKAYKNDRLADDELQWLSDWEQAPVYGAGYYELNADKRNVFCFLGGEEGIPVRMAVFNTETGAIRHAFTLDCKQKAASEKILKLDGRESFYILFKIYPKDWGKGIPYWFLYDYRARKIVLIAQAQADETDEEGSAELHLGVGENASNGMRDIVISSQSGEEVNIFSWDADKKEYIKKEEGGSVAQE